MRYVAVLIFIQQRLYNRVTSLQEWRWRAHDYLLV